MTKRQPLTAKQAQFASLVAQGQHMSQAYRMSYAAEKMKESSIRVQAHKEAQKPHVAAAIQNLKDNHQPTERKLEALREDWVLERLQEEAIDESNRASSRVRALEILGKTFNLFDANRREETEHRSPDEIKQELVERLAEIFGDDLSGLP